MPYIGYFFILAVCLGVILVVFNKIRERVYPYILYVIGAGMVLMTTLAGSYLVGSDIHLEYYYAQLRCGGDVWEPIVGYPQGTSILSYISSNMWAYKMVYPLLFCFVPVILYFVYKKWLTSKQAFLASFLFIAFPAFSMELPTIPKQMIAEVFLALTLYLIIKSTSPNKYKYLLICFCAILMPLIHYSVGIIAVIVFGVSIIVGKGYRKQIGAALVCVLLTSAIYFPIAEDGAVLKKVVHLYNAFVPQTIQVTKPDLQIVDIPSPIPPKGEVREATKPAPGIPLIKRYESLIQVGLGADFKEVDTSGKVFRILQWGVLVLLVVGLWKLRRSRDYWVFIGGFLLIVLLCAVPGWARILNTTRLAHLSLFMLAPACAVALKPRYLLILLIPYFLFTSGFVFEVSKQPNVEEITVPYSIGLSDYRMDLGATFTEDDIKVRDYIVDNNLFPINSDMWTSYFLIEKIGERPDINWGLLKRPVQLEGYVFVRSRNIKDGTLTIWNGIGLRKFVKPEAYGINWEENIIYQSGDARVLRR